MPRPGCGLKANSQVTKLNIVILYHKKQKHLCGTRKEGRRPTPAQTLQMFRNVQMIGGQRHMQLQLIKLPLPKPHALLLQSASIYAVSAFQNGRVLKITKVQERKTDISHNYNQSPAFLKTSSTPPAPHPCYWSSPRLWCFAYTSPFCSVFLSSVCPSFFKILAAQNLCRSQY